MEHYFLRQAIHYCISPPIIQAIQNLKPMGGLMGAFGQYQPDGVIIEGMAGTESPKTLMAYIQNLPPYSCPENLYAARCAIKNQVPFMGAEPTEDAVLNGLLATKYTKKDLDFLYVVQQMGHYYRCCIPFKSRDDLPTVFALWVQDLKKPEYNLNGFKQWYEQGLNMTLSYHTLMDPHHCAPLRHGTPLQQLASAVSVIRDQHILSAILKALKTYKKFWFFMVTVMLSPKKTFYLLILVNHAMSRYKQILYNFNKAPQQRARVLRVKHG